MCRPQTNKQTKHPFIITERPLLLYQLQPHLCFFPPASGVQFIKTLSVRTTPSPSASWKHPHKASLREPSPKSHKTSPHPVSPLSRIFEQDPPLPPRVPRVSALTLLAKGQKPVLFNCSVLLVVSGWGLPMVTGELGRDVKNQRLVEIGKP